QIAASRAMGVFAYTEAEEQLRRCLAVQEVVDPDDTLKRCDLLLDLGESILPQENPGRAGDPAGEAFELAEGLDDTEAADRSAITVLHALHRESGVLAGRLPQHADWALRADTHAQSGTIERIYADLYRGLAEISVERVAAGHTYLRAAIERATQMNDNTAFFAA